MTKILASESSVHVDMAVKQRLDKFAETAGRSSSSIAAAVISDYLDVNEAQVAGIHGAIASLDNGHGIPDEKVAEWVRSWGTSEELPAPTL